MTHIKTVRVTHKQKKPYATYAPRGLTVLRRGDTITIELAKKFPEDSTIDTIEIYNNTIIKGMDTKDTSSLLGSWTRSPAKAKGLKGFFSCTAVSPTQVEIEDTQDNVYDDKFWYSASGKVGNTGKTWSIDPEVINRGH